MEAVNCKQTNKQTELADHHHIWFCPYVHIRVKIYFFKEQVVDHWKSHRTNNCLNTCVQLPAQFGLSNMECHGQCMCFLSVFFFYVLCLGALLIPNSLVRCGDPIHPTLFLIWYWPIFHTQNLNEFERFWACLKLTSTVIPLYFVQNLLLQPIVELPRAVACKCTLVTNPS